MNGKNSLPDVIYVGSGGEPHRQPGVILAEVVPPSKQISATARRGRRWRLPLFLFVATCLSTVLVGGYMYGAAVMTILACHEAGHFIQTRRYRVRASLPFFLPLPLPPISRGQATAALERGGKLLVDGKLIDARAELSKALFSGRLSEKEASEAKTKTAKPKKTTTRPKKKVDDPTAVTPKKKIEKKKPPTKKSGTSELDSLLSGQKKEKGKPKTAPADDVPKKPTKAEVKKAMGPVQVRSQKSCAKYSTGTVQVQVVVKGSNGRVKSASPKGAFAGNQAGKCVAMMARSAKFPKFSDSTFSFTYPIILK